MIGHSRRQRLTLPWFLASLLLMLAIGAPQANNSEVDNQEHVTLERSRMQLNRTVRDLVREQIALGEAQGTTQSWLAELEALDRSLTEGERRQAELVMRQQTAQQQLPELTARIATNRTLLAQQRQKLAKHLRFMYGMGNQGALKMMFSQSSAEMGRTSLLYYSRLIKARNQEFHDFRVATARLRNDINQHAELAATLATLTADLTQEQKIRQEERNQRAQFLERSRTEEEVHQRKIKELTQAKNQLTSFLERLSGYLSSEPTSTIPEPEPIEQPTSQPKRKEEVSNKRTNRSTATAQNSGEDIHAHQGQLTPPVKGQWRPQPPGIFYRVVAKTAVAAIYAGQVVYADWFRGYGLLLIIKHGNQLYSLYGHNSKLLVAQGDWITEREIIASSGDTGTMDGIAGLYFEIRIKGKTVNPVSWLNKQD